ncbi:MAG: zf-HC2 domain-containing protein [Candidatus Brocadiia bacterium]
MTREKCTNSIRRLLSAYADGELPPGRAVSVERHLEQCVSCRAELADINSLKAAVAAAQPQFDDAKLKSLATKVRVAYEKSPEPRFSEVVGSYVSFTRVRYAIGAVAALLLVAFLSFNWGFHRGSSTAGVILNNLTSDSGAITIGPEGDNYAVIRITRRPENDVTVSNVETPKGTDYTVTVDPDTGTTVIRLTSRPPDEGPKK